MREAALGTGNATAELAGAGPISEALYREPNPADGGAANTLDTVHPAWRLAGPRTGDLVVTHNAGRRVQRPDQPAAGNHGGPQTRDNFMAVVGPPRVVQQRTPAGERVPGFDDTERNPDQSENVDVAPTVARLLGYRAPARQPGPRAGRVAALRGPADDRRRRGREVEGQGHGDAQAGPHGPRASATR